MKPPVTCQACFHCKMDEINVKQWDNNIRNEHENEVNGWEFIMLDDKMKETEISCTVFND